MPSAQCLLPSAYSQKAIVLTHDCHVVQKSPKSKPKTTNISTSPHTQHKTIKQSLLTQHITYMFLVDVHIIFFFLEQLLPDTDFPNQHV